jgi:predicted RNA-binding protein with PUA-like domain
MPWLVKTEPSEYAFGDLVRERKAVWDGVSNALALKHLRAMAKGDGVLVYHTGDEKRVVGVAEVTKPAYPDPSDDTGKLVVVDLKAVKFLPRAVELAGLKADKAFAGWDLLRIGRLSVVPTPQAMYDRVLELGGLK